MKKLTEKQQKVLDRMQKGYTERKLSLFKTENGWYIYSDFTGEFFERVNTLTVNALLRKGKLAWANGLVGCDRLMLRSGWANY